MWGIAHRALLVTLVRLAENEVGALDWLIQCAASGLEAPSVP